MGVMHLPEMPKVDPFVGMVEVKVAMVDQHIPVSTTSSLLFLYFPRIFTMSSMLTMFIGKGGEANGGSIRKVNNG